jgi:hypothetical protein
MLVFEWFKNQAFTILKKQPKVLAEPWIDTIDIKSH